MNAQEAFEATASASRRRLSRLVCELREKCPNVPRAEPKREFFKITQHPSSVLREFRGYVSRLAEEIEDEDHARLLEPTGPKILRGWSPPPRPQTAIIAYAAQAAYERRMAREKFETALASLSKMRRA